MLGQRLDHWEGVILDDLGYVQQNREEMEVLFTFLAERYERGSVLLTSNLAFSKWEQIFKDPMTTAAAVDRLVHHSVIVELNIPELPEPSRPSEASRRRAEGSGRRGAWRLAVGYMGWLRSAALAAAPAGRSGASPPHRRFTPGHMGNDNCR